MQAKSFPDLRPLPILEQANTFFIIRNAEKGGASSFKDRPARARAPSPIEREPFSYQPHSKPTTAPVMQVARVPERIERMPRPTISRRRSGCALETVGQPLGVQFLHQVTQGSTPFQQVL